MTTGTTGSAGILNPDWQGSGTHRYRTWSGGNGKYTTFNGRSALSWNSYSMTACTRARPSSQCVVLQWRYSSTNPATRHVQWRTSSFTALVSPVETMPTLTSNDQLALIGKLIENVKGHDFNLAVNLGQMNQVSRMVDQNLRKLGRAAIALKRGDFASAARQLGAQPKQSRLKRGDISGRWLELQYGWLPLISDSFEAAKAFEQISNGPRSQTFVSSITRKRKSEASAAPTVFSAKMEETNGRRIQYECTEEPGFSRQLGLLDPASVIWELTPWSFVVDWFIPIGAYFDAINMAPKLKGRFLQTTFRRTTGMSDFRLTRPRLTGATDWQDYAVLQLPYEVVKYTRITRTPLASLDVPLPRPSLKGALAGKRVWNAIALAQQRFRL